MAWTRYECVKCWNDNVVVKAIRQGDWNENEYDASEKLFKKIEEVRYTSITDHGIINKGFYIDGRYRFTVDKRGKCDGHCRRPAAGEEEKCGT